MSEKYKLIEIQKLVLKLWNDDIESFAKLYSITVDDTYNYARIVLGDDTSAAVATSEIYSLALQNIIRLKDPSLFTAWLRRISYDVCYKKIVEERQSEFYLMINPEEMESLPFSEKQIYFLHDFANISQRDIANALHISPRHVKKDLLSARDHLMQLRSKRRLGLD